MAKGNLIRKQITDKNGKRTTVWVKAEGKAPLPENKHLTASQLKVAKSKEFKSWFGDWEKAWQEKGRFRGEEWDNVSQVRLGVYPMKMYRGVTMEQRSIGDRVYLTTNRKVAETYGEHVSEYFVDAKKVVSYDARDYEWNEISGWIDTLERSLFEAKRTGKNVELDRYGDEYVITPETDAVLIENVVDPERGRVDAEDEFSDEFRRQIREYRSNVIITARDRVLKLD